MQIAQDFCVEAFPLRFCGRHFCVEAKHQYVPCGVFYHAAGGRAGANRNIHTLCKLYITFCGRSCSRHKRSRQILQALEMAAGDHSSRRSRSGSAGRSCNHSGRMIKGRSCRLFRQIRQADPAAGYIIGYIWRCRRCSRQQAIYV